MQNYKQIIIITVALIGLILIAVFYKGLYQPNHVTKLSQSATQTTSQSEKLKIISTNPSPLEEVTILPTQIIELTFNYSLIAPSELKHKIDPPSDIKIELSVDKKTVKFVPIKPYKLGSGYTLFIQPDTKFEGGKVLKEELIYHFKTISYRGI